MPILQEKMCALYRHVVVSTRRRGEGRNKESHFLRAVSMIVVSMVGS